MATAGIVIAASAAASAQSKPSLPTRSVAQLLADVAHAKPLGAFSATIQQTSNLGLPALPTAASQDASVPAALTSGQTISIWYADARHVRVAVPVQAGESDLRIDGRNLWLWNSKTQTATHVVLPAHLSGAANVPGIGVGAGGLQPAGGSGNGAAGLPDTPLAAAKRLLAAIGPSTAVTLQPNIYVAGRAAYQLSVAPKANGSLVSKILIAIDASKYIPLRVQVFARGVSSPAFAVGFTALTLGRPAMSNFSFAPPPGATVKTVKVPSDLPSGLSNLGPGRLRLSKLALGRAMVSRPAWAKPSPVMPSLAKLRQIKLRLARACLARSGTPVRRCAAMREGFAAALSGSAPPMVYSRQLPKQVVRRMEQSFAASLPKNMPRAERAKIIKGFDQQFSKGFMAPPSSAVIKNLGNNGGGFTNVFAPGTFVAPFTGSPFASLSGGAQPTVIGEDWLSVVATPPSPRLAAAIKQLLAKPGNQQPPAIEQQSYSSSSYSSTLSSTVTVSASRGPAPAVLRALLLAAKPVHGKWGSGRLLTTSLLSVLITSNGRVLAGAVTPAVLYSDAAAHAG